MPTQDDTSILDILGQGNIHAVIRYMQHINWHDLDDLDDLIIVLDWIENNAHILQKYTDIMSFQRRIICQINRGLCKNMNQNDDFFISNQQVLIDYILSSAEHIQKFLKYPIIQDLYRIALNKRHSVYFNELMQNASLAQQVFEVMPPDSLSSDYGQAILSRAVLYASDEVFNLLIALGADIHGDNLPQHLYRGHNRIYFNPVNSDVHSIHQLAELYFFDDGDGCYSPLVTAILHHKIDRALRILNEKSLILEPGYEDDCSMDFEPKTKVRNPNVLMMTAYLGQAELVYALIEKKYPLDHLDRHGESAIFYAIRGNHIDIYHRLVEAGAEHRLSNHDGLNIKHLVHEFCYTELRKTMTWPIEFQDIFCNKILDLAHYLHPYQVESQAEHLAYAQMQTLILLPKEVRQHIGSYFSFLMIKNLFTSMENATIFFDGMKMRY